MKKQILATLGSVLLLTSCEDLFDTQQSSDTTNNETNTTESTNTEIQTQNDNYSISIDTDSTISILAIVDSLTEFNEFYSFDSPERVTILQGSTGNINNDCAIAGQVSLNIQSNTASNTITNHSIYSQCQRDQYEINGELDYLYENVRNFFSMVISVEGEISLSHLTENLSFTLKDFSNIYDGGEEIQTESMLLDIVSDDLTGTAFYDFYEDETSGKKTIIISGAQNTEFRVEKEDYESDSVCTLNTQVVDCYTYSFY